MKIAALSLLSVLGSASAFAPSFGVPRASTGLDMARKPFISGNWKLNPQTREEAVTLAGDIAAAVGPDTPDADIALFVPYVFIEAAMGSVGEKLQIGAEVSLCLVFPLFCEMSCSVNVHVFDSGSLFLFFMNLISSLILRESARKSMELSLVLYLPPCSNLLESNGHLQVTPNVVFSSVKLTNTLMGSA